MTTATAPVHVRHAAILHLVVVLMVRLGCLPELHERTATVAAKPGMEASSEGSGATQ